jgi:hypothetical protein
MADESRMASPYPLEPVRDHRKQDGTWGCFWPPRFAAPVQGLGTSASAKEFNMKAEQIRHARDPLSRPENTVSSIAGLLGVSRSTICKYVTEINRRGSAVCADLGDLCVSHPARRSIRSA